MNYENYNVFWLERLSWDAVRMERNIFTKEEIEWAIKQTEYKYFGCYELTDNQKIAVDVLVHTAQHHLK